MNRLIINCLAICAVGFTLTPSLFAFPIGPYCGMTDFDFDGDSDIGDIVTLVQAIKYNNLEDKPAFDVNCDGYLSTADIVEWNDKLEFEVGDVNLDGQFDSTDISSVFQSNEWEDGIDCNSTYAEGDFNGDGEFDSSDLTFAFEHGTYSSSAMVAAAVPEPKLSVLLATVPVLFAKWRRRRYAGK